VDVTLWYFADCPNWRLAERRLRQALDSIGHGDVVPRLQPVETDTEAAAVGFAGSPTFTVAGVDLFDSAPPAGTLACRVYRTPSGMSGVPELTDLVTALTRKVAP
jgi:hypothetical protein